MLDDVALGAFSCTSLLQVPETLLLLLHLSLRVVEEEKAAHHLQELAASFNQFNFTQFVLLQGVAMPLLQNSSDLVRQQQ